MSGDEQKKDLLMDLIIKLKNADKISMFIIIVACLFGLSMVINFYDKHAPNIFKNNSNVKQKTIGQFKIGKVCYDTNNVTECVEINSQIYKFIIFNENDDDIPTLQIKSK